MTETYTITAQQLDFIKKLRAQFVSIKPEQVRQNRGQVKYDMDLGYPCGCFGAWINKWFPEEVSKTWGYKIAVKTLPEHLLDNWEPYERAATAWFDLTGVTFTQLGRLAHGVSYMSAFSPHDWEIDVVEVLDEIIENTEVCHD